MNFEKVHLYLDRCYLLTVLLSIVIFLFYLGSNQETFLHLVFLPWFYSKQTGKFYPEKLEPVLWWYAKVTAVHQFLSIYTERMRINKKAHGVTYGFMRSEVYLTELTSLSSQFLGQKRTAVYWLKVCETCVKLIGQPEDKQKCFISDFCGHHIKVRSGWVILRRTLNDLAVYD